MQIKLEKTEKNTATVNVLASAAEIAEEETHTLTHMAEEVTIKGFRKGKAPLNVVKNSLDPDKLREKTVIHLLGHAIDQAIKELKLKVIANPRMVSEDTRNPNWAFTLTFPLYPEFSLGNYQEEIKKALAKVKPAESVGKPTKSADKPTDSVGKSDEDKKLKVVFDTLLDTVKMDVPDALIEEEVNRSLARLVNQTESLNLTIADYLKSIKKTPEQLREEYHKTATESLKLDFLLFAVAKDQKLTVSEEEVKSLQGAADVKPEAKPYLESVILKRKAVDSLLKL